MIKKLQHEVINLDVFIKYAVFFFIFFFLFEKFEKNLYIEFKNRFCVNLCYDKYWFLLRNNILEHNYLFKVIY
jgi:hypothetical protein